MNRGRPWLLAALGATACLVPIWACRYLPTVDLPQHAAQIALWVHRDDPTYFPAGMYRFNWFTPYLGAYLLTRAFAALFSVSAAVKMTVTVAAVLVPVATYALLRVAKGDAGWALAAVPLAFGVAFYSGFLNFLLAIPVAVLLIAAALRYAGSPSVRAGVLLGSASFALALCHALAFGVGAIVASAALWGATSARATRVRGTSVVLAPLPLVALWAVSLWLREEHVRTAMHWSGWASRPFRLPAMLLGSPRAALGWTTLLVLVAVLGWIGVRTRMHRGALWALIAAAAFFLFAPDAAFRTVVLPERFPALIAILVLPLLRMPESPRRRLAVVALLAALACSWSAFLTVRFRAFDGEMAGFDELLARTEPGRVMRMIAIDSYSDAVPGYPLYWNTGALYQVLKGGHVAFSFSQTFAVLVRFRETPPWAERVGAKRDALNWSDADRYVDYFVFRSASADPEASFPQGPERPRLVARSGAWWLYENGRRRP